MADAKEESEKVVRLYVSLRVILFIGYVNDSWRSVLLILVGRRDGTPLAIHSNIRHSH